MTTRTVHTQLLRRFLAILTGFVVMGVLVLLGRACAARELRAMPDPERHALYERTLETLRTTCARPSGPTVTDCCSEQAAFVLQLPECDDACRDLARRLDRRPTR